MSSQIESYLTHLRRIRRYPYTTIKTYRSQLTNADKQIVGGLDDATEGQLIKWQDTLYRLSVRTQYGHISTVSGYFKWLQKRDYRTDDPTVHLERPRKPRRTPRPTNIEELIFGLKTAPPAIRISIAISAMTGLRCKEIAGIDVAHIDRWRRQIFVTGKGSHERTVPIPDLLMEMLVAYGIPDSGPIMLNQFGRRMTPEQLSARVSRWYRERGMNARAHQNRHFFATQACEHLSLQQVQVLLGHSDISTTAGYVKVDHREAMPAVQAMGNELSALLTGKPKPEPKPAELPDAA